MAVPKRRMSRSNTRSRRSQWKASVPTLVNCPNRGCDAKIPPHTACPTCGTYKGRQVTSAV
ncbi:MAG: 50S ribosomal protein L32 [Tomitella sp.]|nr:50S ribosomal protein L32 [Tomitella sp.]